MTEALRLLTQMNPWLALAIAGLFTHSALSILHQVRDEQGGEQCAEEKESC